MKFLILSRNPHYYTTRRLLQTAHNLGYTAVVADPLKCVLSVGSPNSGISFNGHQLEDFDLVIPRFGVLGLEYSLNILRHFEFQGIPILNTSQSISLTKDKFNSLQFLETQGIPVPHTIILRSLNGLKKLIDQLGGLPLVVKLLRGAQGTGVMLIKTIRQLKTLLQEVWQADYDVILQQFIPEAEGQDIRILVLGGKVIAAMRRLSRQGDFRSNIHQGGITERIKLPLTYKILAQRAARICGLRLAGVDIIESRKGPLIIEINASPGFEALEKITEFDIAREIISYAVKLAKKSVKKT